MSYSVLSPIRNLTFATAASVALWGCQSTPAPEVASTIDTAPVSGFLWTAATSSQDAHNYAAAVGYYQSLYTRDPSDIEATLGLARNLRYTGSAGKALDILRSAMLEHPDNPELKAEVGKAQLAVGDVDDAVATLRDVAMENPEDWRVISALGIAYDQLGEYAKAQAQYRIALEISPKNIAILNNLALSMSLSGDLERGLEILQRAAIRRNSGIQVRQNLALLHAMNGDMETAERIIEQDLPAEVAEHNIELYRRVYPGVAGDHVATVPKEAPPVRQLATRDAAGNSTGKTTGKTTGKPTGKSTGDPMGDGMPDGIVEPVAPERVADVDAGNTANGNTTAPKAPVEVVSRVVAVGVPDVDAEAEPMLHADTNPAHPVVKDVALSAGAHDIDTLVTQAADADAYRKPMLVAEADLDADETDVVPARRQAIAGWPDADAATMPLSVDFAGYDVRDDAPVALPAEAEAEAVPDADSGRAPMLYMDADTADSDLETGELPANTDARDVNDDIIGVAVPSSDSEPSEFDIGTYDEAIISGTALTVPDMADARAGAALVMANPTTTDAVPMVSNDAATPEEMVENMFQTPTAPSLAEGSSKTSSAAPVDSVLAGFVDSTVTPAKTVSADTQGRRPMSLAGGGNPEADALGSVDQALVGLAAQRQASRETHETPAEIQETIVASRSPVPPPPTVDRGEAPAAAPVSDDVMIELGAFPSLGEATRWLVRLRDSHGAFLSGVRFQIKGTDNSQAGRRYRLIAGPMESEAVADDFCERLDGFREDCGIFNPTGDVARVKTGNAG